MSDLCWAEIAGLGWLGCAVLARLFSAEMCFGWLACFGKALWSGLCLVRLGWAGQDWAGLALICWVFWAQQTLLALLGWLCCVGQGSALLPGLAVLG